jgi:hypothetical protein
MPSLLLQFPEVCVVVEGLRIFQGVPVLNGLPLDVLDLPSDLCRPDADAARIQSGVGTAVDHDASQFDYPPGT